MDRNLHNDLTDLLARLLHYQERGEPNTDGMTAVQVIEILGSDRLPEEIYRRYFDEPRFHMQVQRAVNLIAELLRKSAHQP